MQDITTILFWTAIFLIAEPTIANLWPRIHASFLLSYPFRDSKLGRVEQYYNELDYPFRIMCLFSESLGVLQWQAKQYSFVDDIGIK